MQLWRMLTMCPWTVLAIVVMVSVSTAAGPISESEIRQLARRTELASLQGLPGVAPLVSVKRGGEQDGLLKTQLQTDVELRLRKASMTPTAGTNLSLCGFLFINIFLVH